MDSVALAIDSIINSGGSPEHRDATDATDATSLHSTDSPKLSRRTQADVVSDNQVCSEDSDNYPLHSPWCFWFDRSPRGGDAENFFANLRHLATVNTIKAFWSVFNNLPLCDTLHDRDSYHLMRGTHRRPVWEDLDNVAGGMWSIKVGKEHTVQLWLEVLLAAIGEQLSLCVHNEDEICGVSVRIRCDCAVLLVWHQDHTHYSAAKVVDKIRQLVPSLKVKMTFYSSNRDKVKDSLSKPSHSAPCSSSPGPHSRAHSSQTVGAKMTAPPPGIRRSHPSPVKGRSPSSSPYMGPSVSKTMGIPAQLRYTGAPTPLFPPSALPQIPHPYPQPQQFPHRLPRLPPLLQGVGGVAIPSYSARAPAISHLTPHTTLLQYTQQQHSPPTNSSLSIPHHSPPLPP